MQKMPQVSTSLKALNLPKTERRVYKTLEIHDLRKQPHWVENGDNSQKGLNFLRISNNLYFSKTIVPLARSVRYVHFTTVLTYPERLCQVLLCTAQRLRCRLHQLQMKSGQRPCLLFRRAFSPARRRIFGWHQVQCQRLR